MQFSIEKRLFDLFPSLTIGVLVCAIDDNTEYGDDRLDIVIQDIRNNFPYEKPQDHPHIKVWREAFSRLGISASKYYSSIESLLRRVLKGGPFPRINPVVDLYNAVSLKYLVPMGGHAIDPLEGNISLCFARGDEPFLPMDTETLEHAEKDEVIYRDDREVLTRRWVWRQCNKDKVTSETKKIFIPIDIMGGLPYSIVNDIMRDMEDGLIKGRNGRVLHRDVLTKDKLITIFDV